MPLDRLPLSLQHLVLLEWLSPKSVCAVARSGSSVLRRAVLNVPPRSSFSAGDRIVAGGCVRWFHERGVPLRLWTHVVITYSGGKEVHYHNGKLHRDGDLPALTWHGASREWYQHGKLHRENDRPAVVKWNGAQYYQHGKLHRDGDLPAIVGADGTLKWYQKDKLHRDKDDLPAVVEANGTRKWYMHGVLHRDGHLPAVICPGAGWVEWWRHGKRICLSNWKGNPNYNLDYGDVPNFKWSDYNDSWSENDD